MSQIPQVDSNLLKALRKYPGGFFFSLNNSGENGKIFIYRVGVDCSMKQWVTAPLDKEMAKTISQAYGLSQFLSMMLVIRGFHSKEQIESFLNTPDVCFDPFLLNDMDLAVKRIHQALDQFEKICIYGDYDADGVTSTSLLYSYLESLGADVMYYIPERESEGYGMNMDAVRKLSELGVRLIITVDNGIAAVQEVEYANSLHIDTVVTDHHQQQGDILPPAAAVVDPHRLDCDCPFKNMAGVGVTFQLISALEGKDGDFGTLLENYSDLVAIGTIGDIVPLEKDNRILVKHGLEQLSRTDRLGVQALIAESGLEGKKLTSTSVAFSLVPRINAAGRLGSSRQAVKLLLSEYPEEAENLAKEIGEQNQQRQKIEGEIALQIEEYLQTQPARKFDRVLVVDGDNWHGGVIGIVASRIVEKYGKPCIIISREGDLSRGSGRSVEGFSLSDAVYACRNHLVRFGGHPMAAGITIKTEKIDDFRLAINAYAAQRHPQMPCLKLLLDCKLRPQVLSLDIAEELSLLEPFGTGNPPPLFGLYSMTLTGITPCGNRKHLRLTFQREQVKITAMRFSVTPEEFPYQIGDVLDLAVTLERNEYRGEASLSVHIRDLKLHGVDETALLQEQAFYESARRGEILSAEETEKLLPTREQFAIVYRYLREQRGWSHGLDVLYFRLAEKIPFSTLCLILDVMDELNLVTLHIEGSLYQVSLREVTQKVNLDDSILLQELRTHKEKGGVRNA